MSEWAVLDHIAGALHFIVAQQGVALRKVQSAVYR